ncbi:MAG: hypothetical protein R3198_15420 [Marinobacter sp.]|nr:hypothetical protein [Marinobacter sp.]
MDNSRSLFSQKNLLLADAVTCLVMGLLLTFGASWLGEFLHLPQALLFYAGLILFPIALFMIFVATSDSIPTAGVQFIIVGNVGWVAGSVVLLVSGWVSPNLTGTAFIVVQAVAVAILAYLEMNSLRLNKTAS